MCFTKFQVVAMNLRSAVAITPTDLPSVAMATAVMAPYPKSIATVSVLNNLTKETTGSAPSATLIMKTSATTTVTEPHLPMETSLFPEV